MQDRDSDLLVKTKRLSTQKQKDKNKLYSLHAPEAECIAKGKSRQTYEFGVKVPIATTHKEGVVVGMRVSVSESPPMHVLPDLRTYVTSMTTQGADNGKAVSSARRGALLPARRRILA